MLKEALLLWKKEQNKKSTTLHHRLVLFFVSISIFIILSFTLLLALFGITSSEEKLLQDYIDTELGTISGNINENLGRISLDGITIAEDINKKSEEFFQKNGISAAELSEHPNLIEPLLAENMQTLISTITTHYCGGVFIMLDATIAPDADNAEVHKAGVFLKKTQPTATGAVGADLHYLRGPAKLARDNDIMLIGQWKMEYDITDQEFFTTVMQTAAKNPDLPLSRLYYWSERVTLKGNSESGFLLCVPLRTSDGTVFGLCGIEVSDRLFKSVYSPQNDTYDNVFAVMALRSGDNVLTSSGLIAGNYYLTGTQWTEDLIPTYTHDGFVHYSKSDTKYAGMVTSLHIYPNDSPYASDQWSCAVLMPQEILHKAINANDETFIYIILTLTSISFIVSFFISHHYLKPVTDAFETIKNASPNERPTAPYLEINDLFDFLAEKDKEHEAKIYQHEIDKQQIIDEAKQAKLEVSRLAYSRKQEVDPELYNSFLVHIHNLTPTERRIFDLYVSGKHAKEIMEIMNIKENTLKYHNKNIYSKLGVSSKKELLRYAVLMNQEENN